LTITNAVKNKAENT